MKKIMGLMVIMLMLLSMISVAFAEHDEEDEEEDEEIELTDAQIKRVRAATSLDACKKMLKSEFPRASYERIKNVCKEKMLVMAKTKKDLKPVAIAYKKGYDDLSDEHKAKIKALNQE